MLITKNNHQLLNFIIIIQHIPISSHFIQPTKLPTHKLKTVKPINILNQYFKVTYHHQYLSWSSYRYHTAICTMSKGSRGTFKPKTFFHLSFKDLQFYKRYKRRYNVSRGPRDCFTRPCNLRNRELFRANISR